MEIIHYQLILCGLALVLGTGFLVLGMIYQKCNSKASEFNFAFIGFVVWICTAIFSFVYMAEILENMRNTIQ
jgi:hypothetical protein